MKIAINRLPKPGPWGGGNHFVKAFFDFSTDHHICTNLSDDDIDIIFMMDPRSESGGFDITAAARYRMEHSNCRLVQRINECDARKNTEHMDSILLHCSQINDHTVFVSGWAKNYFINKGWQCKKYSVHHNGVDKGFLRLRKKSDDLFTGNKLKIVTHHWSNNLLKGFDIYNFLDYLMGKRDNIEFTYIGRHRDTFKNANCVEPLSGIGLANELLRHDIYISGSRYDPGPNHVLESLALGLPTYVHAEGGGSIEFAESSLGDAKTFKCFDDLEKIINKDIHYQNSYIPEPWNACMTKLFHTLNEL